MEIGQIQCDNLGMTRDTNISALSKGQDGVTNYAFENHNIRVLAVNDNTKFAVTNEKSTEHSKHLDANHRPVFTDLFGKFMGGCKLNHYVIIFTKDSNAFAVKPDYIYRLDYDGTHVNVITLYNGNLNFNLDNPIEAMGYYESEEIQKVYWVDGLNQNRFINIVADASIRTAWNDYSFDFQGHITNVPTVTIEKNYQKAGYFLAGTIQYFMTYYNKYGVETCLIWASDLQYASISTRGAKADENVSCGFDFKITDIDTNYDYLRIYSCYRSGLNGVTEAAIVTDISLENKQPTDVITFTDLGTNKEAYNAQDMPYVGGQDIRANTLDYKQDTLFLGDIKLPDTSSADVSFLKTSKAIDDLKDEDGNIVSILESNAVKWVYKMASDAVPSGVYYYKSEMRNSQEEIAGFKWREVYRFGIQFMSDTGEWTSAYWLGDKYCDCPPIKINKDSLVVVPYMRYKINKFVYDTITTNGIVFARTQYYQTQAKSWWNHDYSITVYTTVWNPSIGDAVYVDAACTIPYTDDQGNPVTITGENELVYMDCLPDPLTGITNCPTYGRIEGDGTTPGYAGKNIDVIYQNDGDYIATAIVNFNSMCNATDLAVLQSKYIAYRLLMADMDATSRRVVEQGVICPTMFNYADRYNNRPYSIPSWIFRPRMEVGNTDTPINRHYESLPIEDKPNAELQGIMEKLVPGFDASAHDEDLNAFMLIFGANDGGSYIKWKLIYYNSGSTEIEKVEKLNMMSAVYQEGDEVMEYDAATDTWSGTGQYIAAGDSRIGEDVYSHVYGGKYKVMSSGYIKNVAGKWGKTHDGFIDELFSDLSRRNADIVFSPAMLPNSDQMKSIAYQKGSAAAIWAIIGAVLVAVAAAVASVFTCGAAAAAGAAAIAALTTGAAVTTMTTAMAMTALTSILAFSAVAAGAGAAAIAKEMDHFKEIDRSMAAKGFLPINLDGHELSKRQDTPYKIRTILEKFFNTHRSGGWALLKDSDFEDGNDFTVPFTRDPSTYHGALGMDYNAYILTGVLTYTNAEEEDMKNKTCLFCPDESIVTMHAPDLEDNMYAIDNSEAYKLDLVGMIPVQAAYGEYDLQCTSGLNNTAQVLQNRFVSSALYTSNIKGLLNGNIYQDFNPAVSAITAVSSGTKPVKAVVSAGVALYKVWMWNRETSVGLWATGLDLKSPIDEDESITEPAARLNHKIFANIRYSDSTQYYNPFEMDIESPVVCMDDQTMLKSFQFGGDTKFYYQNVNTISTYNKPYDLVANGQLYPSIVKKEGEPDVNLTEKFNITDPVNIKYRNTPHILLPFKPVDNIHTILPYCASFEQMLRPIDIYGEEALGDIDLNGVKPSIKGKYYYWKTNDTFLADNPFPGWNPGVDTSGIPSPCELTPVDKVIILMCLNESFYTCSYYAKEAVDSEGTKIFSGWTTYLATTIVGGRYNATFETIFNTTITSTTDENKFLLDKRYLFDYGGVMYSIYSNYDKKGTTISNIKWYITKITQPTELPDGTTKDVATFPVGTKLYIENLNYSIPNINTGGTSTTTYVYFDTTTYPNQELFTIEGKNTYYFYNGDDTIDALYVEKGDKITEDTRALIEPDAEGNYTALKFISTSYPSGTWNQSALNWRANKLPYLFLGELVKKVFDYNTWMGGSSEGLELLTWNVASKATPIGEMIKSSWGDTFYQRWDCEKTYPYTEEDKNSVVDVLSFMLESHINLDGRSDVNRGINNLINLRPSNTIYNKAYSQKDNFFTYQLLDEKFDKKHFEADVLWSLTKTNADDIDKWTCLVSTNEMSLDGRYGTVRKILNVNDVLVAFQDSALTNIRYNENAALATTAGLPLQMGNTGKVDGYRVITDTSGCHNKFSINKNSAGVFYIDDYNKSFNTFTVNGGSADVGTKAEFSRWFKKNLTGNIWTPNTKDGFRTSYDEVTHDLYIVNDTTCLVYNTLLNRFTSFMDYIDTPILTTMISGNGKSGTFAYRETVNAAMQSIIEVHQLFVGNGYGSIYGQFRPYSIEYRLNPDPLHDSIFTNYVYSADWTDPTKDVDEDNIFDSTARRYTTFDTVEAKNEYQHGITPITTAKTGRFPIKAKFRIWRGDIPRDGYTLQGIKLKGDRMRNPWIHLKFEKNKADDSKMTFHNLMVTYYNQYGRI